MSNTFHHNSDSSFHSRLYLLLKDNVKGWSKKIGVAESLIRGKWFKKSYPGADKIIKICQEADVSADWLLLGKEPLTPEERSLIDALRLLDVDTQRGIFLFIMGELDKELKKKSKKADKHKIHVFRDALKNLGAKMVGGL